MAWSIILRGDTDLDAETETALLHKTFPTLVKALNNAKLNVESGNASGANAASMSVDEAK